MGWRSGRWARGSSCAGTRRAARRPGTSTGSRPPSRPACSCFCRWSTSSPTPGRRSSAGRLGWARASWPPARGARERLMPDKYTVLSPELYAYAVEHGARQDDVLRRLAEETARELEDVAIMQIGADQGAVMTL